MAHGPRASAALERRAPSLARARGAPQTSAAAAPRRARPRRRHRGRAHQPPPTRSWPSSGSGRPRQCARCPSAARRRARPLLRGPRAGDRTAHGRACGDDPRSSGARPRCPACSSRTRCGRRARSRRLRRAPPASVVFDRASTSREGARRTRGPGPRRLARPPLSRDESGEPQFVLSNGDAGCGIAGSRASDPAVRRHSARSRPCPGRVERGASEGIGISARHRRLARRIARGARLRAPLAGGARRPPALLWRIVDGPGRHLQLRGARARLVPRAARTREGLRFGPRVRWSAGAPRPRRQLGRAWKEP